MGSKAWVQHGSDGNSPGISNVAWPVPPVDQHVASALHTVQHGTRLHTAEQSLGSELAAWRVGLATHICSCPPCFHKTPSGYTLQPCMALVSGAPRGVHDPPSCWKPCCASNNSRRTSCPRSGLGNGAISVARG